ncbi:hypothetical protein [Streptomyces sp. HG99]|uniref:Uncharacterized protein n=1 Tax=Streptomyces dengpaensis TaxID=2049881 RepID=A0ABN5HUL6_9ACTN|nr:hypothetical protein [Streptomyces sp. HG99]AVH54820.1 hypothetical protein C4B68_02280 [Streptomyces dengpaensis]PIB04048.1 hypothetical protein B1C81_34825 [Streptomyces sp. HG99]
MYRSSEGLYEQIHPDRRSDPTVRQSAQPYPVRRNTAAAAAPAGNPVEADAECKPAAAPDNASFTPTGTDCCPLKVAETGFRAAGRS